MNIPLARREARMIVVLPALIIIIVYAFTFERPHREALNNLREVAAVGRLNPVLPGTIRIAQQEVASLTVQVNSEKHRTLATTRPSLILPARWTSAAGRLDALERISDTLTGHSLYLVNTAPVISGEAGRYTPRPLQDFSDAIRREADAPVPEMWHVEVIGSYADLVAALHDMDGSNAFIMPLEIRMESLGDGTPFRRWSLWLWV